MKTIIAASGASILVDDDDFKALNKLRWHIGEGYARSVVYFPGNKRKTLFMHQLIIGKRAGMVTDHINGNRIDNRKSNLRLCTRPQNCMNRAVNSNSKTQIKGVWKNGIRWSARLYSKGVTHYLGVFDTKELAGIAYQNAAKIHHGVFARI